MAIVLVVDDEPQVLDVMSHSLARRGHEVLTARTAAEALRLGLERGPALAVLDLDLRDPEADGLGVFASLRANHPGIIGMVLTGRATVPYAFRSGLAGIAELVEKPVRPEDLARLVDELLAPAAPASADLGLTPALEGPDFDDMIGRCPAMRQVFGDILKAAALDHPVLILGETGTGKELVARSLHRRSPRHAGPFIAVNCPAVPATLFESEFFGHERGAFTGAIESTPGYSEQARGGTLFLDEIGDLSPEAQAKLLRVLDRREVTRLGGRRPHAVDARVVAATNVDLMAAIEGGAFREDLYWRLRAVALSLPPVRERGGDIPRLIDAALARLAVELGLPRPEFTTGARALLLSHAWPGNVREMEAVLRTTLLRASGAVVAVSHIELERRGHVMSEPDAGSLGVLPIGVSLPAWLASETARTARRLIQEILLSCGGNRGLAAARLRIDVRTLYSKMRRYGLHEHHVL